MLLSSCNNFKITIHSSRSLNLIGRLVYKLEISCITFLVLWIINNHSSEVTQEWLYQSLQNWLILSFHRGRRVDLNEPDLKIFVNHQIISEYFKTIFPIIHHILNWKGWSFYYVLYLWKYQVFKNILMLRMIITKFFLKMILEVL